MVQENVPQAPATAAKIWFWLNVSITAVLVAIGLWYLLRQVSPAEIMTALLLADARVILLGLVIMMVTILGKAWRWRLLLTSGPKRLPFFALFWAIMLGQYVNLMVPFFRLGEIARMYALNHQTGKGKAVTLGTLVVEKTLDMIMLALLIILILPLIVLPAFISDPALWLGIVAFSALFFLYLLAYQTKLVLGITQPLTRRLPGQWGRRLEQIMGAGLEGLAALRDQRLALFLIILSIVIAGLSVLLPYVLFFAFDIQLSFIAAAAVHAAVSITSAPPSTPGKVVVFDGTVAFILLQLGLENEALIIGYTIIFHLVVLLPQIILGSVAAARVNWRWPHRTGMRAGEVPIAR